MENKGQTSSQQQEATYEALRRRRRKLMDSQGVPLEDEKEDRQPIEKP